MVLPLSAPITTLSGKTVDEVFVPRGTKMFVSLLHCNTDPEIWGPDAAEWKPERWLSPLPDSVADARVPGIYSHMSVTKSFSDQPCLCLMCSLGLG
jgi:cytochrome P450